MTLAPDPLLPYRKPPQTGGSRLLVALVMVLGALTGFLFYREIFDRGRVATEPRTVAARGDLAADEKTAIDIFKAASPSVVYITTVREAVAGKQVFEFREGSGSGFIWDNAGDIVTNYHVVQKIVGQPNRHATVTLANHDSIKAEVVGVAPNYDLAVLRIKAPASELPALPIGESHNLQVGQKTYAIGNPYGLDQSLTTGVVSALNRQLPSATAGQAIEGVIQTDAAINPGNSGGPLLDSAGRLIGVNASIISPSGSSAGIGFAVPVDTVNRIVPQLIAAGKVTRPYLGIRPVTRLFSRQFNIEGIGATVDPDSPAAKAGFRGFSRTAEGTIDPGDVLLKVDGKKVKTTEEFNAALEKHAPGDTIELTIWRAGGEQTLKVVLEPPKE